MANEGIWKNLSFCFVNFSDQKDVFFSNKQNLKHIFSDVQKIKKMIMKNDERTMFDIFSKTKRKFRKKIFGDKRKGYFVWRKDVFRKSKIDNGQKKKRRNPKEKKKLKGVSQRDEKRERKRRLKRNTKIWQQKKGETNFFEKKKSAKQEEE